MSLMQWWNTQMGASKSKEDEDQTSYISNLGYESRYYEEEDPAISQDYVIISEDMRDDNKPRKKKMFKRRHYQKAQRNNTSNNGDQQALPAIAERTENDQQVRAILADSLQGNYGQGIVVVRRKQMMMRNDAGNASSDDGEQYQQPTRKQSFRRRGIRAMSDNSDGMSAVDTAEEADNTTDNTTDNTAEEDTSASQESMNICYGQYWWQT